MLDLPYFKQKLVGLRRDLLGVEASGNQAAATVELDQSRVGRQSRMDTQPSKAKLCKRRSAPAGHAKATE